MRTLVVEVNEELGKLWCDHLTRQGGQPELALCAQTAIEALRHRCFDVLVLDLLMPDTSVLAICDFATYRHPEIEIIVVTPRDFFSEGSIFDVVPNARGFLRTPVQPDDLAALVEHYGRGKKLRAG